MISGILAFDMTSSLLSRVLNIRDGSLAALDIGTASRRVCSVLKDHMVMSTVVPDNRFATLRS